jgi:UrcA family protein
MNTKQMPLLLLGAITVAIHLAGFTVVAAGAHQILAQSVSYRDLDLAQPADAAVLYERIGQAAAHVCDTFSGAPSAVGASRDRCVSRAIARTVTRVNAPNLTARHDADWKARLASQPQVSAS